MGKWTKLHPELQSEDSRAFENELSKRIVGQERAIQQLVRVYDTFDSGLSPRNRPIANLMLLGPTGCGKTYLAESAAEILHGKRGTLIKVNCAEYQREHEISKLLGSPPGYLGHRETKSKITQEMLNDTFHRGRRLSFVLFDEIEKASYALFELLLGIMDKGQLSTGTNVTLNFTNTVVFLTSNLGAKEVSNLLGGGIGFSSKGESSDEVDQKIYRVASDAAKKHFTPEFINRLDRVIVFRVLQKEQMEKILIRELAELQERIVTSGTLNKFVFDCKPSALEFLISEGFDIKYGARHLKRAIEKYLVAPFGNLLSTGQIRFGDMVQVAYNVSTKKLEFGKKELGAIMNAVVPKVKKQPSPTFMDDAFVDSAPSDVLG